MSHLISCPDCKKHLQVPDDLLGKMVQCPDCKQTFTARLPDEIASSTGTTSTPPPPKSSPAPWQDRESEQDKKDSKPPRSKKNRRDDDDDDDEDDDRDDDDRRRRRRPVRRNLAPHRGEMVLIFGIVALVMAVPIVSFVLGIMAWIMGNADLREMREGRMDPSGEGSTQAGRIMGMIGVILHILGFLGCCGFYGFFFFVAALGAGAAKRNQPPNFR